MMYCDPSNRITFHTLSISSSSMSMIQPRSLRAEMTPGKRLWHCPAAVALDQTPSRTRFTVLDLTR